jgi:hypothetical protein
MNGKSHHAESWRLIAVTVWALLRGFLDPRLVALAPGAGNCDPGLLATDVQDEVGLVTIPSVADPATLKAAARETRSPRKARAGAAKRR